MAVLMLGMFVSPSVVSVHGDSTELNAMKAETGTADATGRAYLPVKGSAWRLAVADLDGDGVKELIYGTYGGAVRCQSTASAELLWERDLGVFPFALAVADADGDGRPEVYAATADGALHAFNADGLKSWAFCSPLPLYDVAVARLRPGTERQIVCGGIDRKVCVLSARGEVIAEHEVDWLVHRLAAGDLDGDGLDELFVVDGRHFAECLKLENGGLRSLWRQDIRVPEEMRNWENPGARFFAFSAETADLDGDGRDEIVMGDTFFNKQAVMALSGDGEVLWISEPQGAWRYRGETYSEFYSTAFVATADILPHRPGREVVAVAGGLVRLFDNRGELIDEANARVGFTDVVLDGTMVYLGSSPNGDDTVYRVDLAGDWPEAVRSIRRQGRARAIGENLAELRRRVLTYGGAARRTGLTYRVRTLRIRPRKGAYQRYRKQLEWLRRRFPYDNLSYLAGMKVIEPQPPLDENGEPWSMRRWRTDSINGTMTVDEIVGAARWIEEHRVPTVFTIGHSCMPFITLETAQKMLRAAPDYLVGFLSAEDEQVQERLPRYLKHYFGPLADLCVEHGGKPCMTKNKNVWWMSAPAIGSCYEALFGGRRQEVLVPVVEDSNSRTPEINLLARCGLRQAGLVERFQASIISDLFSFCRFHQWEYPKHGHPYLRLLVAHTLLGAADYEFRIMHLRAAGDSFEFTNMGRESTEIFLHMLGKGLVFTPRPEQIASVSPIGFAVHRPPEKWLADGHNGHRPWLWEDDPELHNAVIPHNGCLWGNTPTPEHALQRVLLGKERQFGYHVPPTPCGVPVFVPEHADLDAVVGVEEWWHTDGIYIWREGGEKLTGQEAARALEDSFVRAARRLPFRAEGRVFFVALRMGEGAYRLYAIDPGWLDPRVRQATVYIQAEGEYQVRDLLTGEEIPANESRFEVEVPSGSLRILTAERK